MTSFHNPSTTIPELVAFQLHIGHISPSQTASAIGQTNPSQIASTTTHKSMLSNGSQLHHIDLDCAKSSLVDISIVNVGNSSSAIAVPFGIHHSLHLVGPTDPDRLPFTNLSVGSTDLGPPNLGNPTLFEHCTGRITSPASPLTPNSPFNLAISVDCTHILLSPMTTPDISHHSASKPRSDSHFRQQSDKMVPTSTATNFASNLSSISTNICYTSPNSAGSKSSLRWKVDPHQHKSFLQPTILATPSTPTTSCLHDNTKSHTSNDCQFSVLCKRSAPSATISPSPLHSASIMLLILTSPTLH